jgi:hypothetical protein
MTKPELPSLSPRQTRTLLRVLAVLATTDGGTADQNTIRMGGSHASDLSALVAKGIIGVEYRDYTMPAEIGGPYVGQVIEGFPYYYAIER